MTLNQKGGLDFLQGSVLAALWLSGTFCSLSASTDTSLTGDYIAAKMHDRREGDAVERTLFMDLVNKNGKVRQRSAKVFRRSTAEQKQTVIRFDTPRSVKGMAFLTHDHSAKAAADEQWLYMPAMKKVRRIPSSKRGDYFLGTDFTYNDVKEELKFEPGDYVFTYENSYTNAGQTFHRISGAPSNKLIAKELGYGAFKATVAEQSWMPVDIVFFDEDQKPLKRINVGDLESIDGIWTALAIEVEHLQTGHITRFSYSDISYSEALPNDLFAVRSLKSRSR